MANTKIFTFSEYIKYLQRTKIIWTERLYRTTQHHWISGLEHGKYQNIYIFAEDIKYLQRTNIVWTEGQYRRTQNHWVSGLEHGKYKQKIFAGDINIFTEDKNHKDRKKAQKTQNHWISGLDQGKYKIFIFDGDINCLQRTTIIRTERKCRRHRIFG